jgi:hypothetical protein
MYEIFRETCPGRSDVHLESELEIGGGLPSPDAPVFLFHLIEYGPGIGRGDPVLLRKEGERSVEVPFGLHTTPGEEGDFEEDIRALRIRGLKKSSRAFIENDQPIVVGYFQDRSHHAVKAVYEFLFVFQLEIGMDLGNGHRFGSESDYLQLMEDRNGIRHKE